MTAEVAHQVLNRTYAQLLFSAGGKPGPCHPWPLASGIPAGMTAVSRPVPLNPQARKTGYAHFNYAATIRTRVQGNRIMQELLVVSASSPFVWGHDPPPRPR